MFYGVLHDELIEHENDDLIFDKHTHSNSNKHKNNRVQNSRSGETIRERFT